jgi:hypothetical protein
MTIETPVDHASATIIAFVPFEVILTSFGNKFAKPGPVESVAHFHPFRSPDDFE